LQDASRGICAFGARGLRRHINHRRRFIEDGDQHTDDDIFHLAGGIPNFIQ
jgi:hypothetical protein